jgi:predicted NBD/HSP70 family sugar kinase
LADLTGEILALTDIDQEIGIAPDALMPDVVKGLDVLLEESGHRGDRIYGVGLSLPGTVDQQRGYSLDSPIMSGWDGVALAPFFAELTDAPVMLDNDANVIALAERRGERAAFDDLLLIMASTGLGAGIISGGTLQRGAVQAAGELGHNKTPAAAGLPCRCGDTGCLEAIAGGWALVHALQQQGRPVGHIRDVVEMANSGNAEARRMIRESGRDLGEVIAAAVNLLNPAVLVIGGDMARAHDILSPDSEKPCTATQPRSPLATAGRTVHLWRPIKRHRQRHHGVEPRAQLQRHRRVPDHYGPSAPAHKQLNDNRRRRRHSIPLPRALA